MNQKEFEDILSEYNGEMEYVDGIGYTYSYKTKEQYIPNIEKEETPKIINQLMRTRKLNLDDD